MPGPRQSSIEDHRDEITRRWNDGETCEQTANALTLSGYPVSSKTISRFRVQWGLRKRRAGTVGKTYPNRKRKDEATNKHNAQVARRAEITARTLRGETAEQIATALEAQGFAFKNGASSVLRLQTSWELIPYDHDRARGKGVYDKRNRDKQGTPSAGVASVPAAPKPRPTSAVPRSPAKKKKQKQPVLAPSNPMETLHYPASCSNGPQKGTLTTQTAPLYGIDPEDAEAAPSGPDETLHQSPAPIANADQSNANVAAELMSAEFLVDLATSTLEAAHRVKELYIARQNSRPVAGSVSGLPPTDDDIATAKRKVREAASVMHDLAIPNANPV